MNKPVKRVVSGTVVKEGGPLSVCGADDFSGSIMHVVHMFYMGIQKHLEQTLHEHQQISFSQFVILIGFLKNNQAQTTQVKLAEHLMLTEATVSRHIRTLVAMGLLSKEQDASNKKSYNVSLTSKGLKASRDAKDVIMKELDALFSHISEKEKAALIKNFTTTITLLQQKK